MRVLLTIALLAPALSGCFAPAPRAPSRTSTRAAPLAQIDRALRSGRRVAAIGILLLASLPVAAAAESELDMLAAYMQPYDGPAVQGDHCRRSGGIRADTAAGELEVPATNGLLLHHRRWHDAALEGRVIDDAFRDENNTYGTEFREYHRDMVFAYMAWREDHGRPPLGVWDPATPIPPEFTNPDAVPREVMNSDTDARFIVVFVQCLAHETEDPNVPVPSWATIVGGSTTDPVFGYRALCDFPTLNALGKAIDSPPGEGFHSDVHLTVAGDLAAPWTSPRDPLFHPWHNFLELSVFSVWESDCGGRPAEPLADSESTRSVPAPGVLLGLSAMLIATWLRRRETFAPPPETRANPVTFEFEVPPDTRFVDGTLAWATAGPTPETSDLDLYFVDTEADGFDAGTSDVPETFSFELREGDQGRWTAEVYNCQNPPTDFTLSLELS